MHWRRTGTLHTYLRYTLEYTLRIRKHFLHIPVAMIREGPFAFSTVYLTSFVSIYLRNQSAWRNDLDKVNDWEAITIRRSVVIRRKVLSLKHVNTDSIVIKSMVENSQRKRT